MSDHEQLKRSTSMTPANFVELGTGVVVTGIGLLLLMLTTDGERTTVTSVLFLMIGVSMILRSVGRRVLAAKVVAAVLGVAALVLGVVALVAS